MERNSRSRSQLWRLAFFLFASLLWCGTASGADHPPALVGRISYIDGNVSLLPAGQDIWSLASLNVVITSADRIYTEAGALAEIDVGIYTVRLAGDTELSITRLDDEVMQLGLERGTIRVSVHRLPSDNIVEIDTPNAALTVLEPGRYRVDKDEDDNSTLVRVDSGQLEVRVGGETHLVEPVHAVQVIGPDPVQITSREPPPPDRFDEWSEERDQRLASSGSARYVSSSTPGYAEMDAYGHWVEVAEYGPVWYPAVAADWVPYRLGRWVWVDPWGWSWMDDEVWGFCPFHYGRWVRIDGVWGWLPGPIVVTPVYVPAMVAFLGGPGFSVGIGVDLVGWFPLGPADPFFPWYHYSAEYLQQVNFTNVRNVTAITNILRVNNIENVHYAYRTVATTAVPATVFSNGEPVREHVVHVKPEQLSKAQIISHPPVNPTPRAAVPGKPGPPPPLRAAKANAPGGSDAHAKMPPPAAGRPQKALDIPDRAKVALPSEAGAAKHMVPPHLVTRVAPPPPPLPFVERRKALIDHPGRPLEPVQIENLRAGRPAGPMVDREFPPHSGPVTPERAAPLLPKARHDVRER